MSEESPSTEDATLVRHLEHLAASVDDVVAMLNRQHEEGEIHSEALPKAEHLSCSLKDVIHALTHHEHLAMTSDDVWKALTIKHQEHNDGSVS